MGVTTEFDPFGDCPPNVLEHWWRTDGDSTELWRRYTTYRPGTCEQGVDESSQVFGQDVQCDSPLALRLPPGFSIPLFDFYCDSTPIGCPPFQGRWVETERAGRMSGTLFGRQGDDCFLAFVFQGAVVRSVGSTAECPTCGRPAFGQPDPVVPPPPGAGDAGPQGLGFVLVPRKSGRGVAIYHRQLPRVVAASPAVALARVARGPSEARRRFARGGGCGGCGNDGGL